MPSTFPTSATDILKKLIAIPSVNPMGRDLTGPEYFETALTEYLIAWFRELGIEPVQQEVAPGRVNLLAYRPGKADAKIVLFDAHQDTVPVDGMIVEPFMPLEKAGRLYGRGACDVKGGMAAMLAAFARLVQENPSDARGAIMSCTIDEESTTLGIKALADLLEGDKPPVPRPDWAIIAEPTGLDVVVAHRGAVRWTIRTAGRACHSSKPSEGINAIYRMGQVLETLSAYADDLPNRRDPHPRCGPSTLSVGRIGGGASVNTVPDECWIEVDRRMIPGEDPMTARQEVIDELKSLPFEVTHDEPWLLGLTLPDTQNMPLAERLLAQIEQVVGSHQAVGVPYGTHASRTASIGIPSVVFGPGDIAQAHTNDEWIELAQLEQAAEVYYRFCILP